MKTYNPDVLLCLANLSNDEVFTPPQLANEVLDLLPKEIWKDKTIKFLDPCCKTGVFLREITIRLIEGLKDEIPDLQERVNHILTHQVFGIGITELTALTSRRSLYCSKDAHGEFSICTTFDHPEGNIYYRQIEHDWKNGKCSQCGASQTEYDRSKDLETYAYAFIHKPIEELFKMKFDVIIGNPPYQLSCGKSSDMPLYHKFVEKAKELNPKYICMIIPSRWFSGGKGLDTFRSRMLKDYRIKNLVDFQDSKECFPNNDIKGGVCYFLWDTNHDGPCNFSSVKNSAISNYSLYLDDLDCGFFIREPEKRLILNKVLSFEEPSFSNLVSGQNPFNLVSSFKGSENMNSSTDLLVYGKFKEKSFIARDIISKNSQMINNYKVFIPKAFGNGDFNKDWVKPLLGRPNEICTQTFLVIDGGDNPDYSKNLISYTQTKFFHFLVSILKITQDAPRRVYNFVPLQDFSKTWTDEELYEKYGLTQEEIDYIELMIRPMGIPEIEEV